MELPGAVVKLIEKLEQAGFEAWAVGGCVRDFLLKKRAQDYDVCTSAKPEEIKRAFAGAAVLETGIAHGTVTVLLDGMAVEVTTYRAEDGYSDGRRPDRVCFLQDITQDLARRDFTINAMAYHPSRGLKDPFGGRHDLEQGVLRCVGDPQARFQEDGLRLLRALRFASQLDLQIEPATQAALLAKKERLFAVSAERTAAELLKLLTGPGAGRVLEQWPQVLGAALPEILPALDFCQHSRYHHLDVWRHTAAAVDAAVPAANVRLALLFHDLGKPAVFTRGEDGAGHFYGHAEKSAELAEQVLTRLRLPAKLQKETVLLVRLHDRPIEPSERAVRRALYRYKDVFFFSLLEVKWGDAAAHAPVFAGARMRELIRLREQAERILAEKPCFTRKELAIDGDDLRRAGIEPGPEMGRILNLLLEKVADGSLKNERETLLKAVPSLDLKPENRYTETRAKE
ncbi:MAG: HD domain-containing protein [Oscillospiraceae bacterium]|nr:HD domain-containing protein [Oscillospiraceae bacterium]